MYIFWTMNPRLEAPELVMEPRTSECSPLHHINKINKCQTNVEYNTCVLLWQWERHTVLNFGVFLGGGGGGGGYVSKKCVKINKWSHSSAFFCASQLFHTVWTHRTECVVVKENVAVVLPLHHSKTVIHVFSPPSDLIISPLATSPPPFLSRGTFQWEIY